ncbi:hypothetical protein ACFE04_009675 [Oxalis oulophora]
MLECNFQVRHVIKCVFGHPKNAPPPLEKLSPEEVVSNIWKGEGSPLEQLLQCISPHMKEDVLNNLKSNFLAHDPFGSHDFERELQKSLLCLFLEVDDGPMLTETSSPTSLSNFTPNENTSCSPLYMYKDSQFSEYPIGQAPPTIEAFLHRWNHQVEEKDEIEIASSYAVIWGLHEGHVRRFRFAFDLRLRNSKSVKEEEVVSSPDLHSWIPVKIGQIHSPPPRYLVQSRRLLHTQ